MADNKQVEALRNLGLTDTEIAEVLEADKRIDKGEKLFELSADQKKAEKKAKQADRTPTIYQFTPRERKEDDSKRFLMMLIHQGLLKSFDVNNIEMINPERELLFEYNDKKYKVVLSAPRS